MAQDLMTEIDGVEFRKSTFSHEGGQYCVGIAFKDDTVLVTNTDATQPVVRFSKEEWRVFVAGVKADEFDID